MGSNNLTVTLDIEDLAQMQYLSRLGSEFYFQGEIIGLNGSERS